MTSTSNDNVLKGTTFGINGKEIEIPVSDIIDFKATSAENIFEVTYEETNQKTVELNVNSPVSCKIGDHTLSNIEDIEKAIRNMRSQLGK